MTIRLLALVCLLLLAGCAKPVPKSQQKWVGLWRNEQASLLISAAGRLEWHRSSGGANTSISAPLQELSDHKIVAGVWFLRATFDVSEPPTLREDGSWTVTVDGQRLIRIETLSVVPRSWPRACGHGERAGGAASPGVALRVL